MTDCGLYVPAAFGAGAFLGFAFAGWVWALLTHQDLRKYKGGSK